MNENLRQAYLRTMGIDVFYPREPVPGARPSPEYDFSALDFLSLEEPGQGDVTRPVRVSASEQPMAGSPKSAASGPVPSAFRTQKARAALGLAQQPDSKASASDNSPVRAEQDRLAPDVAISSEPAVESPLHFRLEYRSINKHLAVLLEVPVHAQRQLAQESAVLLRNILRALEIDVSQGLTNGELFNWPLSDELPGEEATARQASQALLGFIAMRQQRDGFANLLVFTSQSGQVPQLLPQADSSLGSDYRLDKLGCWISCVSSLQEMLSLPAIKREVWQSLQALRQRLIKTSD